MRTGTCALLLLVAGVATASAGWFQVTPLKGRGDRRLRLVASDASTVAIVARLQRELDRRVLLDFEGDRMVSVHVNRATPPETLQALARAAGLTLVVSASTFTLRDASELTLTLDVKDADVRFIMREVKQQCGIKNMILDPEVKGTGTFLFDEVPCRLAIRTILASLGLGSEPYPDLLRITQQ